MYSTFSVSTDPRTLSHAWLEIGNGIEYPDRHYEPDTDMTRVYRDVLKYVHASSEYSQGTVLTFHYKLSGATATAFSIYALVLSEQDVEFIQKDGKLLFR